MKPIAYTSNAGGNYDVVFPSQDFVPLMIQKGLLAELDKGKIPNLSSVDQNITLGPSRGPPVS